MSETSADDRTEQPTSRRLQKAREQGQIARSREVNTVALLVGVATVYHYFGAHSLDELIAIGRACWSAIGDVADGDVLATAYVSAGRASALVAVPLLTVMVLGVVSQLAQGGWLITLAPIAPKLTPFDPTAMLGRLAGRRNWADLGRTALAATLAIYVVTRELRADLGPAVDLHHANARGILAFLGTRLDHLVLMTGAALVAPAVVDYFYQRYSLNKRLKMTKQEVKEEARDEDGDPLVKGRVSGMRREMVLRRSLAQVPTADVVITNPQHVAVALRYRSGSMAAPKLVAKGADTIAAKIREIARAHDVPILERPPLARWIYRHVAVGAEIPESLYKAIAEILAFVYRTRGARKRTALAALGARR
ncbi:MAG: flagellar type III secretion system protein FlhB [bacterium]